MGAKLDAVNQLLKAIGEDPVQSLTSGLADATTAEATLDEVSKEIQAVGWHSNTDEDITMSPDSNGEIRVAPSVLRIDASGRYAYLNVVPRVDPNDGVLKLFDAKAQSFSFSSSITVDVVYLFDFEAVPFPMQRYIAAQATIRFQQETLSSVALDKMLERRRDEAWAAFQDAECESEDANVLRDSAHCRFIAERNSSYWGA